MFNKVLSKNMLLIFVSQYVVFRNFSDNSAVKKAIFKNTFFLTQRRHLFWSDYVSTDIRKLNK